MTRLAGARQFNLGWTPAEAARDLISGLCMSSSPGNVLIVEDDPDTREMVRQLLAMHGFYALAAADGLEALHLLRAVRHRAPDAPCRVLLDLAMPRLSGKEFRRSQLGDPTVASVPIAVMSGASDLQQRAEAMGAVATLAKPLDINALIEVVKRYCA